MTPVSMVITVDRSDAEFSARGCWAAARQQASRGSEVTNG